MKLSIFRRTVALAGLFVGSCAMANQGSDICGAKEQGNHMLGKHVSFSGKVVSDGMHTTLLLPHQCDAVGYSIAPEENDSSPSAIIRQALMRVGHPGTVDKDINVDVDAVVVVLGSGKIGIKVTKLRRLVMIYPPSN